MDVDDVVDLDDGVLFDEPIPVGRVEPQDVGPPGFGILAGDDPPPVRSQTFIDRDVEAILLGPFPFLRGEGLDVLGLLGLAEIVGKEGDELLDADVVRVVQGDPGDVHLLVVPEEHVDHAPRGRGFLLEAHEAVEDLAGAGAPVQDVAELDEVRFAADPVEVPVDEADLRVGEDEDEAVVVAVEVGDGHDALDSRPRVGDISGGGEAGEQDEKQQQG